MSRLGSSKKSGGSKDQLGQAAPTGQNRAIPASSIAARARRRRRSRISLAVCAVALVGIGAIAFRALARDQTEALTSVQPSSSETTVAETNEPESVIEVVDMDDYEPEDTLRIEIPLDPSGPVATNDNVKPRQRTNTDLDPLQLVISDGQMVMTGTARSEAEAQQMVDQASEVFGSTDIIRDFTIDPTAPDPSRGVVVRKPVAFASGSAVIRDEFKPILDACADVMVHNPRLVMTISGHTDSTGDTELNLALAEERAQAVVDYYTEKGIEPAKFDTVAAGESSPAADNSSRDGRQANRRADLEFQDVFEDVVEATNTGSNRGADDDPTAADSNSDESEPTENSG